jgi:histidyl-tRNA synthetase
MKELGGADLSGIGFGIGLDRVLLALEAEGLINFEINPNLPKLFLIALSDETKLFVTKLLNDLRISGVSADMAYGDRALKGSMKAADKSGAEYVVVIGPDEVASGKATLKAMKSGQEKEVRLSALKDELK